MTNLQWLPLEGSWPTSETDISPQAGPSPGGIRGKSGWPAAGSFAWPSEKGHMPHDRTEVHFSHDTIPIKTPPIRPLWRLHVPTEA